jgi:hypothetical protein
MSGCHTTGDPVKEEHASEARGTETERRPRRERLGRGMPADSLARRSGGRGEIAQALFDPGPGLGTERMILAPRGIPAQRVGRALRSPAPIQSASISSR